MKTLYTLDNAGRVRFWYMEVNPNIPSKYRTVSGLLNGSPTKSEWTQATAKNIGKANFTTAESQALAEIEAKYRQKLDSKYYESIEEAKGYKFFAPMLAKTYNKEAFLPSFVQPKLDGYRCIASSKGLFSRQGKRWNLPHIEEALAPIFEESRGLILDGELYNHNLKDDFNTLGSLIKKEKRTESESFLVKNTVQYHVYDMPSLSMHRFARRFEFVTLWLTDLEHPSIRIVETHEVDTLKELETHYANFIADGYEGAMVRLNALYEPGKRSNSLLKLKDFMDAEFELVKVEEGEGNWAGAAKTAVIRLPDGREQSSGMRGSFEFLTDKLESWSTFTHVTVRYQNLTPDGFLRFPIIVDWHKGQRTY